MKNQVAWPSLSLAEWKPTYDTLHMWSQIVGKVRMRLSPWVNHWWHSALYMTPRGLTTSLIPYGEGGFEISFDLISHVLRVDTSRGESRTLPLNARSVAVFYGELMELLGSLGIQVKIDTMPKEVPNPVPCDLDDVHASYEPRQVEKLHQILLQSDRALKRFRSDFIGKCSPVHFFWGSFDLAVTRFSGRRAPERPGVDSITRVAYSHEVISHGFWLGSGNIQGPAYYAYAAPEPEGFSSARVSPGHAFYNPPTKGFVLMYDEIRETENPERMLLDFFQSTYEAAADLASWDRENLERAGAAAAASSKRRAA